VISSADPSGVSTDKRVAYETEAYFLRNGQLAKQFRVRWQPFVFRDDLGSTQWLEANTHYVVCVKISSNADSTNCTRNGDTNSRATFRTSPLTAVHPAVPELRSALRSSCGPRKAAGKRGGTLDQVDPFASTGIVDTCWSTCVNVSTFGQRNSRSRWRIVATQSGLLFTRRTGCLFRWPMDGHCGRRVEEAELRLRLGIRIAGLRRDNVFRIRCFSKSSGAGPTQVC